MEQARLFGERTSSKITYLRKLYFLFFVVFVCVSIDIYMSLIHIKHFVPWLLDHQLLAIIVIAAQIILLILVNAFTDAFSTPGLNWIAYAAWLLMLAYNDTFVAVYFDVRYELLMVCMNISFLAFALLIYSFTTKYDLTVTGGSIFIIVSNLLGYEFFLISTDVSFVTMIAITAFTIVFGLYFVYISHESATANVMINLQDDPFIGVILAFNDILLMPYKMFKILFARKRE